MIIFIRDELTLCVTRLQENDSKLYEASLNIMREKIRSSTSSLTSVPKPLKFLRNHFDTLKEVHTKLSKFFNLEFSRRFEKKNRSKILEIDTFQYFDIKTIIQMEIINWYVLIFFPVFPWLCQKLVNV